MIQNTISLTSQGKRNGVRKHEICGSKHDTTYILSKKEMKFLTMKDVIQCTVSLTS